MSTPKVQRLQTLGITGTGVEGNLVEAVASGPGWRPLLALGAVSGVFLSQGVVLLLAPEVAGTLGRGADAIATALLLWVAGVVVGTPFGLRAGLTGMRTASCAAGCVLIAVGLLVVAVAGATTPVIVGAVLAGVGSAVVGGTQRSLLADLYPPLGLTHVSAAVRALGVLIGAVTVAVAFPLADVVGLTWSGVIVVLATFAALAAGAVLSLDEPVRGALEAIHVRRLVKAGPDVVPEVRAPSFAEALRRLYAIPTVRPLLGLTALLTAVGYGLAVFGYYVLTERGGLGSVPARWALAGGLFLGAVALLDRAGDLASRLRQAPAGIALRGALACSVAGGATAALGLAPWPLAQAAALAVALAALTVCLLVLERVLLLVVPSDLRGAAGTVVTAYAAVLGVGLGGAVLRGLEGSQGLSVAFCALGAAALVGALVLRAVSRQVAADVQSTAGSLVEAVESAVERAQGGRPPLLSCRGINFSYGPLQILFDVDFTVDEGEMVALLGTNGAGKSTLLRVISGLGLPSSGAVRVDGQDITYAEPGDRVRAGVSQIPGGKAVFGPLSVVDNLRLYGYALGRDKKTIDAGIEESFATFPRLAKRRNSLSSTMSGGEQQMLALSKALILKPRLLLIDELSLGLAPKVVGELLTLVRSINATGTAVVLVEQSVNVALSLARHAYFMEKGQVRFDGPTAELLERPDILRSVFLSGVAAGTPS